MDNKLSLQDLENAIDGKNIIVQEVIEQHEDLRRLHDKSINTVRIMVCLKDGKVEVLSSVVRIGRDNARVDNASNGGIVCGINADGSLKKCAFDVSGNRYDNHPNGAIFSEFRIPNYDKCVCLVKQLSPRFVSCSKLQSWDFAIGKDSEPILIEVNLTSGQLDFHQMCNGPIFGNRTKEVLKYVADNNPNINIKGCL